MASARLMRLRYAGWGRNAGDVMVVAISDNQTDEACYPLLPEGSVTVHVDGGATSADYQVTGPAEVRRLLREIACRPTRESAPVAVGAD